MTWLLSLLQSVITGLAVAWAAGYYIQKKLIAFTRLSQDRAITIKGLYAKLVKMDFDIRATIDQEVFGDENTQNELLKLTEQSANDFLYFFYGSQILLEPVLCEKIKRIDILYHEVWRHFIQYKGMREKGLDKAWDEWDKAWNTLKIVIPPVEEALKKEFRKIIEPETGPRSLLRRLLKPVRIQTPG